MQNGQRCAGLHGACLGTLRIKHHEYDPRSQPIAHRRSGREQPRKIGPVELDLGEVIRLDADRTIDRIRAHDLTRAEADHIAWTHPAEVNRALADPKMRERLAELGGKPIAGTPEDFGKVIAAETAKWEKVVISSGAKVE